MGNKAKKITVGVLATILLVGAVCAGLYTFDVFKGPKETVVIEPASDDAIEKAKNVTDEATLRELLSQNCELDIQVTENLEITKTLLVNGVKKVTGDVTLKAGYDLGGGAVMLNVAKGATLTVNGWNIDGNGIASGVYVNRNATLNHMAGNMEYMGVYGVISEGTTNLSDKTNIAHVGEGAVKVSIEGTVNITGGTYKDAGKYMVNVERGAALNVSGEPLFDTAVEQLVYNYGETKITGGTFLNSGYRGVSNYAKMTMEYQGNKEDGHIEVGNTGNVAVYSSSSFKVSFKGIYGHDAGANVFLQSNTQSVCKVEDCLFDNGVGNAVSLRGNVTFTDVEVKNATASGILVQQNGVAKLKNVKVSDVQGRGITVESATLTGKNIDIKNTGGVGFGAQVIENVGPASVDVSNVHLQDVKGNSIKVSNGATMTFENSTFEKSKRTSVYVDNGKITLKGVQVLGNLDTDVQAVQVQPDGELVISGNTVITGGTMRAVAVYGGKFTMNGGAIKDNRASETGAAVHITKVKDSVGTFIMNGGSICDNVTENNQKNAAGVNVSNDAVFTMNGGKIYGNTTSGIGGGVRVAENAVFTLNGGSIYGNTAKGGGGVRIDKNAKVTMTGGSIYQNISTASGGGVHILGEFIMSGGKIYQNQAISYGGAMNIASETNNKTKKVTAAGSFVMTGGEIYGNSAVSGGGAIQVSANTTAKLSGGTVKNNDTDGDGDGIRATGKVTISDEFYLGNDKAVLTSKDVTVKVTGNKLTKHSKKDPLLVAVADGVATGHVVVNCDSKKAASSLVSQTASGNGSYLLQQKDENLVVAYAAADMDMTGADKVLVSNFKELKAAITGTKSKRYVVLSADIEMESSITVPNGTTVYIRDDGVTRTLSRKDGTSATFFNTRYGTGLYLAGTEKGKLILDGAISEGVDASNVKSMVTAKGGTSISNVIFKNNGLEESTSLTGIFVYQTYGHIDMKDSTFQGAKGNSGAVGIASLATGYAEGCSYVDNHVNKGGGAIRLEKNAEFTAVKCTFEKNSAGTSGGAVVSESATFVAYDCDFKDNQAKNDGGVIKSNGGTAKFLDSDEEKNIMENNTCGANGGAIWAKGNLTVQTYLLKENKSGTGHGGGIFLDGTTTVANVEKSEFHANESQKNCGGAISNGGATLTIVQTEFIENKTTTNNKNGGAIYSNNANAITTITESVFTKNEAKDGGAIRITAGTLDMKKCTLTENSASENGGAINTTPSDKNAKVMATIEGGTFEKNHGVSGGAVYVGMADGANCSVVTTTDVLFKENYTIGNTAGAVYAQATYTDNGSKFENNKASSDGTKLDKNGGALYLNNAKASAILTGSVFEGNQAGTGGAIMMTAGTIQADACAFKKNSADNGGAFYVKAGKVTMTKAEYTNNQAKGGGGGAICTETTQEVEIKESLFEKNMAKGDGGAIKASAGNLNVTDCNFIDNSAATGKTVSPIPEGFTASNGNGGALYLTGTVNAMITATEKNTYMFSKNKAHRDSNTYTWGAIANNSTGEVRYSADYVFEYNTNGTYANDTGIGCGVHQDGRTLIRMDEADSYGVLVTAILKAGEKELLEVTLTGNLVFTSRIDLGAKDVLLTNKEDVNVVISVVEGGYITDEKSLFAVRKDGSLSIIGANAKARTGITIDAQKRLTSGLIYAPDGTTTLKNITVTGANAGNYGGVVDMRAGKLTVENCLFTLNQAKYGGAISTQGGTVSISNSDFGLCETKDEGVSSYTGGNKATAHGGAIYMSANAKNVTIDKCNFYGNEATSSTVTGYGGGAICQVGGTLTVKGSGQFAGNMASGNQGGAIYSHGVCTVEDCTFKENSAKVAGGALRTQNALTLKNCVLDSNSVTQKDGHGGAIYVAKGGTTGALKLEGTGAFTNNRADKGSAISVKKDAYWEGLSNYTFGSEPEQIIYNIDTNESVQNDHLAQ